MKRHRFDPFSFVFGALFLIIGATFMGGGEGIHTARAVRIWPATIVVIGLTLAIWAVGRAIHRKPAIAVSTDSTIDLDVGPHADDDP